MVILRKYIVNHKCPVFFTEFSNCYVHYPSFVQQNRLQNIVDVLVKKSVNECHLCQKVNVEPCPITNMAATGNSFFWLVDSKQSFPLKLLGQMNRNLVGSIYGRSSEMLFRN
jgi:hypothetical protein